MKAAEFSPVTGSANGTWALFEISVLGLFLELMLIRWVGTEIRIFAYLQNAILVVCFLGLGMGCWTCRGPATLRDLLLPLVLLIALLVIPFTRASLAGISYFLSLLQDFVIWDQAVAEQAEHLAWKVGLGLVLTLGLMLLVWSIFVPVGRILGRLLEDHPRPVWAYSVNVLGSLAGIWLFVGLSALDTPPWIWSLAAVTLALGYYRRFTYVDVALGGTAVVLAVFSSWYLEPGSVFESGGEPYRTLEVHWSPYQKLVLGEAHLGSLTDPYRTWEVSVNSTSYQSIRELRPAELARRPGLFDPQLLGLSQYDLPLLFQPQPQQMLVLGAGTGNDVAGGLRHGAGHIVAVEIDPVIVELGRRFHPERPYQAPQVEVVVDDARSYFVNATTKFDLIVFGLLDAHTATTLANARLDHYVYTRESIEQAKRLLADGGVMVPSFAAQKPYIADRMAGVLRETFHQEPFGFFVPNSSYGAGGTIFVAGDLAGVQRRIAEQPRLATQLARWQQEKSLELNFGTPLTSDDWPYIYLERHSIPALFYLLAGLMGVLTMICWWRLKAPGLLRGWGRPQWHFFFLGAAFLLLEVQNISKAAVALGNTWLVNAVIISAILVMVLLANSIAARWPQMPLGPVYVALVGTCVGLYFIDLAWFLGLAYPARAVVVGGLTSLPILCSGIIFVRSFAEVAGKDLAIGANLLGGLVGAMLQPITFMVGIRMLLLVVAFFYVAAFLTRFVTTTPLSMKKEAVMA